jgi:membrane protein DedA with SNARE-associated domain
MMSDLNLNELVLTWMVAYGAPALALCLAVAALGVPLPGSLMVIAAGAFVRQGVLDLPSTFIITLAGVVTGDFLSYSLGRGARGWITGRYGNSAAWQSAVGQFEKHGGLAVYLTRWLFTPIAVPVNLVTGSSGYPAWRFLMYDIAGEATWFLVFGGLGYAFGSQWEAISEFLSNFSGFAIGLLVVGVGIYLLWPSKK